MKAPVLFLSFANDQDRHLSLLKEESRKVYQSLEEVERRGYIKIHREESAVLSDVFHILTKYQDQIAIFHYGGHASGTTLQLEGGAGYAEGLAEALAQQSSLKLVFLNGCSSKGHVQHLLKAGVKAVIATSIEIGDQKATEFAYLFYRSLGQKRTIGQAFRVAKAYLAAKYQDKAEAFRIRSIGPRQKLLDSQDLPWGLYINETCEQEVLHWKLPHYRPVGLPRDIQQYIKSSFQANAYILLVLDEMCKYNPNVYHQLVEQRGDQTVKKDSRYYPEIVIRNFPWPIGSQIRLLRLYDQANTKRIEHLLSTYITCGQVLYYILLSDLWEQSRNRGMGFSISPMADDKTSYLQFDFLGKLPGLHNELCQTGLPYVQEFDQFLEVFENEQSSLHRAYQLLEQVRAIAPSDLKSKNLTQICVAAEQAVAEVLKAAAFLSSYRMLTVRNILIDKPRFGQLAYELEMGPLNAAQGIDLGLYQDESFRRKNTYADSVSVVLVHNENQLDHALNLSPFIMDKNTFVQMKKSETTEKDKLAHIFLLGWEQAGRLHYLAVEHSCFTAVEKESDQIHTDMRLSDFLDGTNIDRGQDHDLSEFGFDLSPRLVEEDTLIAESPKVFQLLKDQFDLLIADLQA